MTGTNPPPGERRAILRFIRTIVHVFLSVGIAGNEMKRTTRSVEFPALLAEHPLACRDFTKATETL